MVDGPAVERKLAAILAADVAEYSRLMGVDEVGTLRQLQAYRTILDNLIAIHHGRIFNTAGDSVIAEFASAVAAVECAVAVSSDRQRKRRPPPGRADALSHRRPCRRRDRRRIEPLRRQRQYRRPARGPGRTRRSVSVGAARDQIGSRLPVAFTTLGEQRVKNIADPVRIFKLDERFGHPSALTAGPRRWRERRLIFGLFAVAALVLIGAGATWWRLTTSLSATEQTYSAPRLSMVVLPFANLSNDPQKEYFADGITDDLTTDLSRIADSVVIARNTAFTYKGKEVDARKIGRELGVRYVVEGSVQHSGKEVRINVQLVDAATGAQLWAERFDRDLGDLFALQNEITARVARALQSQLAIAEAARPIAHPDALDFILRGRAEITKPISRETYDEAVRDFETALALDPSSADAQAWLAAVLVVREPRRAQ